MDANTSIVLDFIIALQPPPKLPVQGDKGKLEFHYVISCKGKRTNDSWKARIQNKPILSLTPQQYWENK